MFKYARGVAALPLLYDCGKDSLPTASIAKISKYILVALIVYATASIAAAVIYASAPRTGARRHSPRSCRAKNIEFTSEIGARQVS